MRNFYKIILFCALITGSFAVRAQATYDAAAPERNDPSKAVHIFPNPAVEYVHIRLEHVNMENVKVSMHNIIGNEINIETEKIDEHELRIRVKDFDSGYYLIALKDEQSQFRGTYKFLKK